MGDLIADLKKPDKTDNAGPESATEVPTLITVTLGCLARLQFIDAAAQAIRYAVETDILRQECGPATLGVYTTFRKALDVKEHDMTTMRPSMSEIEDAARTANDKLTEQRERLDQQEADQSGQIEDMEQRIIDLNKELDEANKTALDTAAIVTKLQHGNRELNTRLNVAIGPEAQGFLSCKIDKLEKQTTELQHENAKLAVKLYRWNKIEKEGAAHIQAAFDDIQKFLDVTKTSPSN
jgi:chromosome segregation ATPase